MPANQKVFQMNSNEILLFFIAFSIFATDFATAAGRGRGRQKAQTAAASSKETKAEASEGATAHQLDTTTTLQHSSSATDDDTTATDPETTTTTDVASLTAAVDEHNQQQLQQHQQVADLLPLAAQLDLPRATDLPLAQLDQLEQQQVVNLPLAQLNQPQQQLVELPLTQLLYQQQQQVVDLHQQQQHLDRTGEEQAAGSSQAVQHQRMMWPDQLFKEQVDRLTAQSPLQFDQAHNDPLSMENLLAQSSDQAYHLPQMPLLGANLDLTKAPLSLGNLPLAKLVSPSRTQNTEAAPAPAAGQMLPPPPKRQSVESAPELHAERPSTGGFYTPLLRQRQKPLVQLSIPRPPSNPFRQQQKESPTSSIPFGIPLGSPSASLPNLWHGKMPLSPPPLKLSLNSPTGQKLPSPAAIHQGFYPSLPVQKNIVMMPNPLSAAEIGQRTATQQQQQIAQMYHARQHQQQQQQQQQPLLANVVDRKMKRPMYEAAEEASPNVLKGGQMLTLQMMAPPETARDKQPATQICKTVHKVHHIINLTLLSMDIPPKTMEKPLNNAVQGHGINFDHIFALIESRMQTTSADQMLRKAGLWLLKSIPLEEVNVELSWMMGDIQRQAQQMFGRPLFQSTSSNDNTLPHAHHQVQQAVTEGVEAEPSQQQQQIENAAMVYFLYARLYRKLAGLLQTPFFGLEHAPPVDTRDFEQLVTHALLRWVSAARQRFAKQFDVICIAYPDFRQKQILFAQFDKSDEIRERLNVAQLTVEVTLAPLVGLNVFNDNVQKSMETMKRVISADIAKLITQRDLFDVTQIANLAQNYTIRSGAASTFLQLFNGTIREYKQIVGQPAIYQLVHIYWILYQKALAYLMPEFDQMLAENHENEKFVNCWMSVKNFLINASQQLAKSTGGTVKRK